MWGYCHYCKQWAELFRGLCEYCIVEIYIDDDHYVDPSRW